MHRARRCTHRRVVLPRLPPPNSTICHKRRHYKLLCRRCRSSSRVADRKGRRSSRAQPSRHSLCAQQQQQQQQQHWHSQPCECEERFAQYDSEHPGRPRLTVPRNRRHGHQPLHHRPRVDLGRGGGVTGGQSVVVLCGRSLGPWSCCSCAVWESEGEAGLNFCGHVE